MDERRRTELTERLQRANEQIARAQEGEEVDRRQLTDGLADKSWALFNLGEPAEALTVIELLLQEVEAGEADSELAPDAGAAALYTRACCLWRLDRRAEGLADLETAIARYADDDRSAVRERIAQVAWTRLHWRWRPRTDGEVLELARDLLRRCTDASTEILDRYAALALATEADTQRRMGDLTAAIATRRRLLSEYPDVRPRSHPLLVLDHWPQLARDLTRDDRPGEAAQVAADLIVALEEADESLTKRQTRIADALSIRAFALRRDGRVAEADAVSQELQARFASADERSAREVAAQALVDLIGFVLRERNVDAAIITADELVARFTTETDATAVTRLGEQLEGVFGRLTGIFRPQRIRALAALASLARIERFVVAEGNRPRLKPTADELRRLRYAGSVNARLAERFKDDPDPRRHAIYLRTITGRGLVCLSLGRVPSGWAAFDEFMKLDATSVSAIVESARPVSGTFYPWSVWAAAFFATGMDLGTGPEAERTRAAILKILGGESLTPRAAKQTAWLGQRWMASEARKSARRAAAIT